jgi:hypothetical protein
MYQSWRRYRYGNLQTGAGFIVPAAVGGGSFPINGILDNFNRADEGPPPSASWSSQILPTTSTADPMKTASNFASGSSGNFCSQAWASTPTNNQEAYITTITGAANYFGVWVRASAINTSGITAYEARCRDSGTNIFLYRWDNDSTRVTLTSVAQTWAAGDSLGMSITGSSISVYFKSGAGAWTLVIGPFTDANYTSGKIGMGVEASALLDNFGGGSI